MRHLLGIILALVLAAALYFGAGWGVERIIALRGTITSHGAQHALTSSSGLLAVAAIAATGLFLGILLVAPRVSPLATGLPGLALLGWSALVVIHSNYAMRYVPMPGSQFTAGTTYLLFNGMLGLLGAAMIVPLAIPSRWYRREPYVDEETEEYEVQRTLGLVP